MNVNQFKIMLELKAMQNFSSRNNNESVSNSLFQYLFNNALAEHKPHLSDDNQLRRNYLHPC